MGEKKGVFSRKKPIARVLVIDSDAATLEAIKRGLQSRGFVVDTASNSDEAMQIICSHSRGYCLMLSNIHMPTMSGFQLVRCARESNPTIKAMLLTPFEIRQRDFSRLFPSIHLDGLVQKPVVINDLADRIIDLIGKSKKRIGVSVA